MFKRALSEQKRTWVKERKFLKTEERKVRKKDDHPTTLVPSIQQKNGRHQFRYKYFSNFVERELQIFSLIKPILTSCLDETRNIIP
jgi:hypothetical protein